MYQIINNAAHQARNIQWLEFELSNNCQYANDHKWCPRSRDTRGLVFLRTSIVHKVVEYFKAYDFSGRVYLSGYSEPLLDPRLTELVKYIKKNLPNCNIDMFTNGLACDENLLFDIRASGVDSIWLSVYSDSERERLRKIVDRLDCGGVALQERREGGKADVDIDGRIKVYEPGVKGVGGPCYMPTLYYFVRNNGDVNMCFWDWKYTQTFGNLYRDSVEDTLMNNLRLEINCELVNENRQAIHPCIACGLPDYRCTREYQERMKL